MLRLVLGMTPTHDRLAYVVPNSIDLGLWSTLNWFVLMLGSRTVSPVLTTFRFRAKSSQQKSLLQSGVCSNTYTHSEQTESTLIQESTALQFLYGNTCQRYRHAKHG